MSTHTIKNPQIKHWSIIAPIFSKKRKMYLCGQGYTPEKVAKTKAQVTCKNCLYRLQNPLHKNLTRTEIRRYNKFKREHPACKCTLKITETGVGPNIKAKAFNQKNKLIAEKDITDYESW